jgi:hypothetical protein
MKRRILIGALLWTLLITLAHIQLNLGWGELKTQILRRFTGERGELLVGFLPVT